ncbi:MAG TPA: radical SAM protein [Nitrospirota bacterium]|nr:radical SAM protein [Nitrospirota bacterium]
MKVLIIATNRSAFPEPVVPIGACMVAEAADRAGHTVRVLDLMFASNPLRSMESALRKTSWDIIGLSVRNIDNNDMREPAFYIADLLPLIEAVRRLTRAPIILGGASLMVMPEEILRVTGASCTVLNNGEVVFPLVLEKFSNGETLGNLPGVAYVENGVFRKNLSTSTEFSDEFMVPRYHLWIDVDSYRSRLSTVPLQTKVGCQFQCSYCTYRNIEGSSYRLSDPQRVVKAVERIVTSGLRDIEFVDSVFNAPYDHAMAVCEALARVRLPARFQSMNVTPLFVDDELLSVMEYAGFAGIGMTVESASDKVLRGLRKAFTSRHVYAAAETVRRHRLPCLWIFMLGGPGETEETVKETLRFAETQIRQQDAAFFAIGIRIYPGTELETTARKQGMLSASAAEMLSPVFYVSPEVDAVWIEQQVKVSLKRNMNFMSAVSLNVPYLSFIHQVGYRLGFRTPLWRYTRSIRRGLRFIGMDG